MELNPKEYSRIFKGQLIPESSYTLFFSAALGAAKILKDRSTTEYEIGKEILDAVMVDVEEACTDEVIAGNDAANLSLRLMVCLQGIDAVRKEHWTDRELLGIFVCSEIVDAWISENGLDAAPDDFWESEIHKEAVQDARIDSALVNAITAMGYADMLRTVRLASPEEELRGLVEKELSIRAKNAVNVRHAKTNKLKSDFLRFCSEHGEMFSSKTACARSFYDRLLPQRRSLLRETNAIRTLLDWERAQGRKSNK